MLRSRYSYCRCVLRGDVEEYGISSGGGPSRTTSSAVARAGRRGIRGVEEVGVEPFAPHFILDIQLGDAHVGHFEIFGIIRRGLC